MGDIFGDRWSQMSMVLYLNDDFASGETRFFPDRRRTDFSVDVPASRGAALFFYHGEHPLSQLHEGSRVSRGTKYIIRVDVLYMLPQESGTDQPPWMRRQDL